MSNEIWVVADLTIDGKVRKVTFEALSEARKKLAGKLGGPLCGVLLGSGVSGLAAAVAVYLLCARLMRIPELRILLSLRRRSGTTGE